MIKVLIVDDSLLIRQILEGVLSSDPEIKVVGTAVDAYDARAKIKELNPDVVTLDIEMPKMDGLSFLEKIMTLRPMPVVMISTLTSKGADATIKALELGAVDYVGKPGSNGGDSSLKLLKEEIISKVKIAAKANVRSYNKASSTKPTLIDIKNKSIKQDKIIAIGSSTGGVEALKEVLTKLPKETPPVLIVQHMPEKFTKSFAQRMDSVCAMTVHEATDGQKIQRGHVYIAHGGSHLELVKGTGGYICRVYEGENVSGHCPSVDVLFDSVAKLVKDKAIGVILTGMGKDGAKNMLAMRQAGAFNIGQDASSCVVYGMPKEAKMVGAIDIELPLNKIADEIIKNCIS